MSISGLIATYGYWAVFALVAAESLGIPLPGETALIIAAAYAGHTHQLSPWIIFAAASAGAVTGDNIGFWIGHKGGYRLARRYGPKVRVDERKLKIARYLFDTHGPKVVFFGRFISVLRIYAAFLAGTSRMRWHRFLFANAAGAIAWAGAYTLAAYLAGTALQQASATIGWALLGTGLAATLAAALLIRRLAGTLADRAEAAYPGPLDPAIPHGADMRRLAAGRPCTWRWLRSTPPPRHRNCCCSPRPTTAAPGPRRKPWHAAPPPSTSSHNSPPAPADG